MENDQKNEQQEDDTKATDDLDVREEEAEGVAGGKKRSDPDVGGQRA